MRAAARTHPSLLRSRGAARKAPAVSKYVRIYRESGKRIEFRRRSFHIPRADNRTN